MTEVILNIACAVWIAAGILMFVIAKRWEKRFSDLYNELKNQIEEEPWHQLNGEETQNE